MTTDPASPSIYSLSRRLRAGETVYPGWVNLADPLLARAIAQSRLDGVVIDMQHGQFDTATVMQTIGEVAGVGKSTIVRVPVGDFAMAARAFDMGAAGVIAPMINTADDARALVDFVKYPPVGRRSWGPMRAMDLAGRSDATAHLHGGADETLALVMLETRDALANIDEILAVPGIDGTFVGPFDLSVSLSNGAFVDPNSAMLAEALAHIQARTHAAGKIPAAFGGASVRVRALTDLGFRMINVGWDTVYLDVGITAMIEAAGI
ncbi:HpcH/HpaI aldolase family protein [Siculibacillus lacustris]|nr:aldolase/citrate lyase family protein [Siculibacillus lacustris]